MAEQLAVTREIKIAARPDQVFPYFVDPQKAVRWKAQEAQIDARPGGTYRLRVAGDRWATGEYLEIDPPTRLVYTWGWEGNSVVPPGSSTVEVTLEALGEHTIVRLTHRGLPSAASVEQHAAGWDHYFERLGVAAAGGDPGPDPWNEQLPGGSA